MFRPNYLTLLTLLLALIGCAHTPSKKAPVAALRITIFDCGTIEVKDVSVFSPGVDQGKKKTLTNSCYLIEHPKGRLLWDAGFSDDLADKPEGLDFKDNFHLTLKKGLVNQLEELGIQPSDIDLLGLSHFHLDHIGNATAFRQARVLVQKHEYETAFAPDAAQKGLTAPFVKWLKAAKVEKLSGDYDVFGDGTVIIKSTPGHTPGHQSLFVQLPKAGAILLTGDLYHFTKNRQYRRVPGFNWNKQATLSSMTTFESFASKKGAKVWIQHDLEQNATLPHAPQSID